MARGTSRAQSELSQSFLTVPGQQIGGAVRAYIEESNSSGGRFIKAAQLYADMTEDAKSGKQVSLTAMNEAGALMRKYKTETLAGSEESKNSPLTVTPQNTSIGYSKDSFISSFDRSDTSGQTYTSNVIKESGKKLQYAQEALKILRNAPDAFEKMNRADIEKFVDGYVKDNLTPGLAAKFKGVKWETYNFPS